MIKRSFFQLKKTSGKVEMANDYLTVKDVAFFNKLIK